GDEDGEGRVVVGAAAPPVGAVEDGGLCLPAPGREQKQGRGVRHPPGPSLCPHVSDSFTSEVQRTKRRKGESGARRPLGNRAVLSPLFLGGAPVRASTLTPTREVTRPHRRVH